MNKDFIEQLKNKISIVDVISKKIKLRRSGKDLFGICPFHQEKTGSFKVDGEKGYYYCFGCGAHGDVIKFIQDFEKITFKDAVKHISESYGIPLPANEIKYVDPHKAVFDAMHDMKNWFASQLVNTTGKDALEYLNSRKITKESIDKFEIGFCPSDQSLSDYLLKRGHSRDILLKTGVFNSSKYNSSLVNRYSSRLIFPIADISGKCVGFGGRVITKTDAAKYINSPETDIFIKSNHLYGYSIAKKGKTREIIIVEGYLDVIAMHQAEFDGAVAPLGTAISETQIQMCWNVCDTPIIALDGDNAGIKASYRWIDRILLSLQPGKSFKFAKLPDGSDPDTLIYNKQNVALKRILDLSSHLSDWIWDGAFSLYPSETPEQKASVVKMIDQKIDTISDNSIKRFYKQKIKEKEFWMHRRRSIKNSMCINPQVPVQEKIKIKKIFIVTIINHPYIIDVVGEDFVKIAFEDKYLEDLKSRIMHLYEQYRTVDVDTYIDKMKLLKIENDDLFSNVLMHASYSSEEASSEDAIIGWNKLLQEHLLTYAALEDLQNALSDLESSFSEKDWNRLKALKKETLLN